MRLSLCMLCVLILTQSSTAQFSPSWALYERFFKKAKAEEKTKTPIPEDENEPTLISYATEFACIIILSYITHKKLKPQNVFA